MNVKRFFAANSKDALAMVRKALGPNAMILANKSVNGGNEVLALAEDSLDYLEQLADFPESEEPRRRKQGNLLNDMPPSRKEIEALRMQERLYAESLQAGNSYAQDLENYIQVHRYPEQVEAILSRFPEKKPTKSKPVLTPAPKQHTPNLESKITTPEHAPILTPKVVNYTEVASEEPLKTLVKQPVVDVESSLEIKKMLDEMRVMRGMLQSQLSELVSDSLTRSNPVKSGVLRNMLAAGFSVTLSRKVIEKMPADSEQTATQSSAQAWAKSVLSKNLLTMQNEADLLDKGGVFAVIGPTGVGKTTTTAKLAARYVMKHGAQKLALITTDGYRIGGHEQLRIYGKILGVMVHAVKDESDLKLALQELKGKHTILIDTVGLNQRDKMVAEQINMLSTPGAHIQKLLCLSATNTAETLTDVVAAYKSKGLAGCVLTKMDEAVTVGSALDVLIRQKLKLYYLTDGQRVPEDMRVPNAQALIEQAFTEHPYQSEKHSLGDDELSMMLSAASMQQFKAKELSFG